MDNTNHDPMPEGTVRQVLAWGAIHQERISPAETLFTNTGRRIYVIGNIDGQFRPLTNPYDLHAFGHAHPDDPLAGRLQGVWAQPVKGLAGYGYTIEVNGERWPLIKAETFTQTFASAQFDYQRAGLRVTRLDSAAQELPVLFSTLILHNTADHPLTLRLIFQAEFDLQDTWFTTLADRRNQGQVVSVENGRLVARAEVAPERWAVVVGGDREAEQAQVLEGSRGELTYLLTLAPAATHLLTVGIAIESQGGADMAQTLLSETLPRHSDLLADKQALYEKLYERGPRLVTPDPALNTAFDLARATLQMLEADSPALGRYFYAGLEIFAYWFSCDGAYATPGLLAAGLEEPTLNHIRIGLEYQEDGRVPHQIAPSGRVAFSGNAEETPLWVMGIWDAYRWTGNREFLAEMYPGAIKGLFDYVLGTIDPDQDGYASGPGMVEVEGMGAEKLDTAAYTWAALGDLGKMAMVMGDATTAERARQKAEAIAARFDADWWDETGRTYAMSLTEPDNQRYPVPHWAVAVPQEVGLSTPEHAAQTFATLRQHYLNRWGLKHTVGDDERVWTLPNATLSRAAFRYSEPELGLEMLRYIAETLSAGSIGVFHELIPEGACFIQLWSAGTFIRGIIEDLLGIQVDAAANRLSVNPQLPPGWDAVRLENLQFDHHRVTVEIHHGEVTIKHL